MAVLTKFQICQLNRKMLGLGAPVVIDGAGYNKFDFDKMSDFVDCDSADLTDKQLWFIALSLGHYKNTQLTEYKTDIEETISCYAPSFPNKVRVIRVTQECVKIVWRFSQKISAALKGKLDKSQYRWNKVDDTWILSISWDYINETCAAFMGVGLDVSELSTAKPPVEQMTLFP